MTHEQSILIFGTFVQTTRFMEQFTSKDLAQIQRMGINTNQITYQLNQFRKGFKAVELIDAATVGNGIIRLEEKQLDELTVYFDQHSDAYELIKFVPASGAASRMFKHLFEFIQESDSKQVDIENAKNIHSIEYLLKHLDKLAFYDDLSYKAQESATELSKLIQAKNYKKIVELIVSDEGLGYGSLPKALLKFHAYADGTNRLALEEHLVEAAHYCASQEKEARIHFTISPEHRTRFEAALRQLVPIYEERFGIRYVIGLSEQKTSTDTIAVDINDNPFRNQDGSLLFRPGGHGALIENVQDLNEDIIFIKNIDNIVPDELRHETYSYKKALGGLLMQLQNTIFEYMDILDGGNLEDGELEQIREFAEHTLHIMIPDAFEGYSEIEKIDFLFTRLNRPIRICGMVKNEGEPGGGPYWTRDSHQTISLQIVEASQMDLNKPDQAEIVRKATHFNPVDLVCGIYNFQGQKFDLKQFIDLETAFISIKSQGGRKLKALELPGLWNGAMADWITIFVETPLITFNPVKTVNDLLRPQHQKQQPL